MEAVTCLTTVPTFRCLSFNRVQYITLIIPTALEVIISTGILYAYRDSKSRQRILVVNAEGWIYFLLALIDMLGHVLPAVRDSLSMFRTIDLVVGGASFLPILVYTLLLFVITRNDLLDSIPARYQMVAKILLAMLIPVIVTFNEVASFLNISYRLIPTLSQRFAVAVGFARPNDQSLWFFLTSFTLAFMALFQALVWCFTFIRVVKTFIAKRRIETEAADEGYFFNGIGWFSAGVKLGALETVIGFASGGFSVVLIRRIIRFVARVFLCIGVAKGMDNGEDFSNLDNEIRGNRTSFRRSRLLISNPRFSTFRQLTPTATEFYEKPRAAVAGPSSTGVHGGILNTSDTVNGLRHPQQRVTVHYDKEMAPTLHMRFSALDLPSPAVIVNCVKARPLSDIASHYAPSIAPEPVAAPPPTAPPIFTRHTRSFSEFSNQDSLHSLVNKFPGLPPRVTPRTQQHQPRNDSIAEWDDPYARSAIPSLMRGASVASRDTMSTRASSAVLSRSSSRRKPVPTYEDIDPFSEDEDEDLTVTSPIAVATPSPPAPVRATPAPRRMVQEMDYVPRESLEYSDHGSVNGFSSNTSPGTMNSGYIDMSQSSMTTPGTAGNPFAYDDYPVVQSGKPDSHIGVTINSHRRISSDIVELRERLAQQSGLESVQEYSPQSEHAPMANAAYRRPGLPTRIKSVGKVQHRFTPAPIKTGHTRGSIYIEPISIPPKGQDEQAVVIVQDDNSSSLYSGRADRDSDVFGKDTRHIV